ncbi:MAG: hypothetical protein PHF21_05035 [Bacilli bacterium]|nr:hypothetical protein [Bacilli bacterium]
MLQNILVLLKSYGFCVKLEGETIYINRNEETQSILMFKHFIIPQKMHKIETELGIFIKSQYQNIITNDPDNEYTTIYIIKISSKDTKEIGRIVCNAKQQTSYKTNMLL